MGIDLQKASLWKRISAFLFDFVIFCIVAIAIAALISAIVGFDSKLEKMDSYYNKYAQEYGVNLEITAEEYEKLPEDELKKYNDAAEAFSKDNDVITLNTIIFNLIFLIVSLSLFMAFSIIDIVIPLFLKNGQTLGKKMFGIALMRTDGVKVSNLQIIVRAILGKYTIETMVPVLLLFMVVIGSLGILGIIIVILLLILQIFSICISRTNSAIHDLLAVTVVIDYASQMIFESEEQMMEYKKQRAASIAQNSPY